jgi:transcriptional regulator with PAS, ATPase and Fis domain
VSAYGEPAIHAVIVQSFRIDEIGELSPEAQIRLLRVLQEKEIERIGGSETVRVDIRIIAATHRNLEKMLSQGKFREDLYFRLRVFPVAIPPLRQRREDIPDLVRHFIQKKSREMKLTPVPSLAAGVVDLLISYAWPGNVRELENAVERALIVSKGSRLEFPDIHPLSDVHLVQSPGVTEHHDDTIMALDMVMARHIRSVLKRCDGRIEGDKGAARLLNIHSSTLRKRMQKLGIPFGRRARQTI